MLSDRAFMALSDLDNGARLNSVHSVARELIAAGLAIDEWGYLRLTEQGRKATRAKVTRQHIIADDNMADLSYRIDPMANPTTAAAQMATPPAAFEPLPPPPPEPEPIIAAAAPAPSVPMEPTSDARVRAMRCAGIATGKTGIEVQTAWVLAFLAAWLEQDAA